MKTCFLCPRNCGIDRETEKGFCGAGKHARIAKAMLHKWEEPCICYGSGSGAIFFSGCQMRCVFCQNHEISQKLCGNETDDDSLSDLFLSLEAEGACNINLVSPTPYLNSIIPALEKAKAKGLSIPVLMNSGGYEKVETLRRLNGLVDIYLPDFKFFDSEFSSRYADAVNYAEIAVEALAEMKRQASHLNWEGNHLTKGLIIRHLILPGNAKDSLQILHSISDLFPEKDFILSLMWQYIPMHKASQYPELNRRVTKLEYQKVVRLAQELSFPYIYTQEKESACTDFVPDFAEGN